MPRVLVVDDQKDVRAMVAIVLRVNRYDVVEAESGAAGPESLQRGRFRRGDRRHFPGRHQRRRGHGGHSRASSRASRSSRSPA